MAEEKKATPKKTTKKTTTKKAEPKVEKKEEVDYESIINQLQEQIKLMQEQMKVKADEPVVAIAEPEEKWTKAKLYTIKDEFVEVRSVYDGGVTYDSPKTKISYFWTNKGDIEVMTIEEVLTMNSTRPKCLSVPWLAVNDPRVIEGLGLGKVVDMIEKIEDTDALIEMDLNELEELIKSLNTEQKNNLRDEIAKKIEANEIDSYVVVVTLKRLLEIN